MNQPFPQSRRLPTQAAEGLPRWRWTLSEFDRFVELGILTEADRVELIGGEIVPLAAKGVRHEDVRAGIENWISRRLPIHQRLVTELGWRPDEETYCEPDLLVYPANTRSVSKVPAGETLLLIEVADTTLKNDLTTKASLYSRLGVREYWVVEAYSLKTHVHREPLIKGYGKVARRKPGALLTSHLLPDIALRLRDLGLDEASG